MTANALSRQSNTTIAYHGVTSGAARARAIDLLVESVALRLLAWSARRVVKSELTHERLTLLRENERDVNRGGSVLGR